MSEAFGIINRHFAWSMGFCWLSQRIEVAGWPEASQALLISVDPCGACIDLQLSLRGLATLAYMSREM